MFLHSTWYIIYVYVSPQCRVYYVSVTTRNKLYIVLKRTCFMADVLGHACYDQM